MDRDVNWSRFVHDRYYDTTNKPAWRVNLALACIPIVADGACPRGTCWSAVWSLACSLFLLECRSRAPYSVAVALAKDGGWTRTVNGGC